MTDDDRRLLMAFLEDPGSIWIHRSVPIEITPGTIERFRKRAQDQGYVEIPIDTIRDRNGRDEFEIYRFEKTAGQ